MAMPFADSVELLLCDADGNLFPSEEPAFVASCGVTNAFLSSLGSDRRFEPAELRLAATGKNFRATAEELARDAGATVDPATLEWWVEEERRQVSAHLGTVLQPDPSVSEPLARLAERFRLAVVSSSATARLDVCFRATGLETLFPRTVRFSADDSLPQPASKPDPAVYVFAAERLGVGPDQAIAIEDSLAGVRSAVAAGFPTVGNVVFVAEDERAERVEVLRSAGAAPIVESWHELEQLLTPASAPTGAVPARAPSAIPPAA
jgi:beta-phosphoglucomutase-like phosphatase (HAD superfamily)